MVPSKRGPWSAWHNNICCCRVEWALPVYQWNNKMSIMKPNFSIFQILLLTGKLKSDNNIPNAKTNKPWFDYKKRKLYSTFGPNQQCQKLDFPLLVNNWLEDLYLQLMSHVSSQTAKWVPRRRLQASNALPICQPWRINTMRVPTKQMRRQVRASMKNVTLEMSRKVWWASARKT